ncbi:hypothetical protein OKW47_004655 [Paraburkholderia atlantica]
MEQSSRRVECLPTYNHLTCNAIGYVYYAGNFYRSTASFKLPIQTTSNTTACGPVLVTSWCWPLPLLLRARVRCIARFVLRQLRTANCELRTANCELQTTSSTVRFKSDTRGRSHRWSSEIRRSMEKSVGAHARMQLREARGFGGLIWRIDVTTGFMARRAAAPRVNRVWRNRRWSATLSHRDARAFFVRRSR